MTTATDPTPITLDGAARLAEQALARAERTPGTAVVLTPYVVRTLLDAAGQGAGEGVGNG